MNDTTKCNREEDRQRHREAIGALAAKCPLGPQNPTMCPLYPVRKKQLSTRARWVQSLKDDEIEFLIDYHRVCQKWQEAGCP